MPKLKREGIKMKEEDILYENGDYWLCKARREGYEVYKSGITHSVRCAIIGYEGTKGLELGKAECNKRANAKK
jgi:hypothetical protein